MLPKNKGFTILEVSIVVTVIAIIVGAIFVSAAMVKSARLQAVMGDVDMYTKAVSSFKDKYNYLPGDMPTATSYWGALAGCPAPAYSAAASKATCNGDGNGHIGDQWLASGREELFAAWQQLADAGFINNAFSGMSGTGSTFDALPGINVPVSAYDNNQSGYTLLYVQPQTFGGDINYYPANYGHIIAFGARQAGDFTQHSLITPSEALQIDRKIDDGLPASGMILAGQSNLMPNCTTSNTPSLAQYKTAYKGPACALFFITGF